MLRPLNDFIVEPLNGLRYQNTEKISGVDIVVNGDEESHRHANRHAIVKVLPQHNNTPIEEGDILLVHHNVFKFYHRVDGKRQSGRSYLREGQFLLSVDDFFAYKRGEKWSSFGRYCFVEPILKRENTIDKNTLYEPLLGRMVMANAQVIECGIKEGDVVLFTPDSEYEFKVDGSLLYRVFSNEIVAKHVEIRK
jgi:hypothetical protein